MGGRGSCAGMSQCRVAEAQDGLGEGVDIRGAPPPPTAFLVAEASRGGRSVGLDAVAPSASACWPCDEGRIGVLTRGGQLDTQCTCRSGASGRTALLVLAPPKVRCVGEPTGEAGAPE